ncbi:MAG: hypothetical protein CL476_06625 [Acidobacteria bacterium]|jgi:hypothetical protein|nr:hypothetical protein [Acidobacteriota bacterium]
MLPMSGTRLSSCCSRATRARAAPIGVALLAVVFVYGALVPAGAQTPAVAEAELQEAERLFEAFEFQPAVELLDRLVGQLLVISPAQLDADARRTALSRAYDLRAQSKFNLDQIAEAEADFETLVQVDAGYRLPEDLSPRVLELFEAVRRRTVGLVLLEMDPPGTVAIDERVYTMTSPQGTFEVAAGPHTVTTSLPGHRGASTDVVVVAGESVSLEVVLTRTAGSLTVATQPPGAEIVVDGEPHGVTLAGVRSVGPSVPVLVMGLTPGQHRLQIVRDCFTPYDVPFNIPEPPTDIDAGTIELEPAVATAVIEQAGPGAVLYVDGERRGAAGEPVADICEGPHVVEVRSPRGRFLDRREWRAGDHVVLQVELRRGFALIDAADGAEMLDARSARQVEDAVNDAQRLMVFAPLDADLRAARNAAGQSPADPGLSPAERRGLADAWTTLLDAQGVAWLSPIVGGEGALALHLLAAGSGTSDVIPLDLSNLGSRAAVIRTLGLTPPPVVRASLEVSLVDLAGIEGAAVIRLVPGGSSDGAGLAVGDVVVGLDGSPVTAAADVGRALERLGSRGALRLDVVSAAGSRNLTVPIAEVADAVSLTDLSRLSNPLLLDMEDALADAETPLAEAAARLNLAIVHIRLANWDLALRELEQISLPDGPGVSAGTVAYLTGLSLTAVNRLGDAQSAFEQAVAAAGSQLYLGGPSVAPLAQQRLDEILRP